MNKYLEKAAEILSRKKSSKSKVKVKPKPLKSKKVTMDSLKQRFASSGKISKPKSAVPSKKTKRV